MLSLKCEYHTFGRRLECGCIAFKRTLKKKKSSTVKFPPESNDLWNVLKHKNNKYCKNRVEFNVENIYDPSLKSETWTLYGDGFSTFSGLKMGNKGVFNTVDLIEKYTWYGECLRFKKKKSKLSIIVCLESLESKLEFFLYNGKQFKTSYLYLI